MFRASILSTLAIASVAAAAPAPRQAAQLEFQLPLPGESIPPEGGGLLVQTDSTVRQVVFRWTNGGKGSSAQGTVQFEGFFQAQTGPLPPGKWTLEAQGFDAQGKLVARRATSFLVDNAETPAGAAQTMATARVVQDFYLSTNAGLRFGAAENDLRSYRSLKRLSDGGREPGPRMEPYDQNLSGDASMVYQLQQGHFRLKVKGSTDLSETWGHAASPSRLGADLHWKSWAELHLGDQYPAWSQLLMDGTRVRGAGIGLAAMRNGSPIARIDAVVGTQRSAIDPQVRDWDGALDTLPAQYRRVFQAVHLGLGDGTPVGWNLTVLHAADRTGDVDMALQDDLGAQSPRENLAVGTDLVTRLWKNRIEAYAEAAMSITTDDTRHKGILDSLRESEGLELPDFVDDLVTVNMSTRGIENLSYNGADVGGFFWDNMSIRSGVRLLLPLGRNNRIRLEPRWIHVGSQFQSFARSVQETPRTGLEWSAAAALSKDELLLSASGAETETHPSMGLSVPTHTVNMHLSVMPANAPAGWYAQGGATSSGGGSLARNESWNTGTGLYGTIRTSGTGRLHWRASYGFFENTVNTAVSDLDATNETGFVTRRFSSSVATHSAEANLRWRPVRDFESRTGYMLASMGIPGDTAYSGQSQTHRIQGGFSVWALSHRLEAALDGSFVLRPDQTGSGERGWDQGARITWDLQGSNTLRLSQRWSRLSGTRQDLRFDAGWEAWF